MKRKTETLKQILYAALGSIFLIIYSVKTNAQILPIIPDNLVASATSVNHTNNDIKGPVTVWDDIISFPIAFISFGSGAIPLNNGQSAYDPDVSVLGIWTIAVYEDPSANSINADIFKTGLYISTKIISHSGRRPKIDADDGGVNAEIVWEDISTPTLRSIMNCTVQIIGGGPTFSAPAFLLKGPATGTDYADPDVAVEFGMHYTCIRNGNDLLYDGAFLASSFSNNPRISSGTIFPDDVEVVAERGGEIYGFSMATITGTGGPPPNPIHYGTGTMPVCAYVYDVFAVLWEQGGTIVAYLCSRDGFTITNVIIPQPPPPGDLCYVSINYASGGQSATSVSGFGAIGIFDLYSSFGDAGLGQVSDKMSDSVTAPADSGIFRIANTDWQASSVVIYPTPFTDEVIIKLPFDSKSPASFNVSITDALGRNVYETTAENQEQIIWKAGDALGSGIYYLKATNSYTNFLTVSKLLKL